MELYHTNSEISNLAKAFWLFFYVDGSGTEWLDIGLPIPTYLHHANNGYFLGYAIDGYFATRKGGKFLNDIIIRFLHTFKEEMGLEIERLPYRPYFEDRRSAHLNPVIYRLENLAKHLAKYFKNYSQAKKEATALSYIYDKNTEDALFDAIRFPVYDFVKANGKSCLTMEYVETIAEIAYNQIGSNKGWSTAKAKAKAVYNWVMEYYSPEGINNWNYVCKYKGEKEEELKMTRSERALANAKKIKESKRKAILNTVTGILKSEYIKHDGTWNIYKLSKDLKMSKDTVRKHIKELREERLIDCDRS